jgi:hypothetical protein
MAKIEAILKSEIVRLARREIRMVSVPMARDARLLKNKVSQIRKTVSALERFMAAQKKEVARREIRLEASPEELKKSRLSPRLIQTVRKRLGIAKGIGPSCWGYSRVVHMGG